MISIDLQELIDDYRLDFYLNTLQQIKQAEGVEFNFRRTKSISPAGLAILCCLIDAALEQKIRVHFVTKRSGILPFADHLKTRLEGSNSLSSPSVYNFEAADSLLSGSTGLDISFLEKFETKFFLDEDLLFDCKLILQELIQNSVSHSGAERHFAYAGLWKDEIHCGVLDMGVSIPAKLRQKYTTENDVQSLLLALEEGVTTRRVRAGGLGLYYFYDILKKNGAKLTIASGGAQVRFYFRTRRSQKTPLKIFLPGTWCFGRLPYKAKEIS